MHQGSVIIDVSISSLLLPRERVSIWLKIPQRNRLYSYLFLFIYYFYKLISITDTLSMFFIQGKICLCLFMHSFCVITVTDILPEVKLDKNHGCARSVDKTWPDVNPVSVILYG